MQQSCPAIIGGNAGAGIFNSKRPDCSCYMLEMSHIFSSHLFHTCQRMKPSKSNDRLTFCAGFVLNLESPSLVQPTLNALLPRFGPRSGGRRHSVSPPKPAAADPVSDFACRTLWVGQVSHFVVLLRWCESSFLFARFIRRPKVMLAI